MTKIHLLRGRVVVREIPLERSATIWTPVNPRDVKIHRGTVLGLGAPALTSRGAEVPFGFGVGDVVLYAFVHNEREFTRPWPPDGLPATWLPQSCVSGVVECGDAWGKLRCTLPPRHPASRLHREGPHQW